MSLTANEQYLLELINRARLDPVAEAARSGLADLNRGLAAGTISGLALQPLAFNPLLEKAARAHSQWMIDTDTFSHTGAGGSTATQRMIAAGYSFAGSGSSGGGENIALAGTTGTLDLYASIVTHHEGLFLSDGHRRNLLNANYREVGLGQASGAYTSDGSTFNASLLTQDFAPSATVFVTGVAYRDADGDAFYSPGEGTAGLGVKIAGGLAGTTEAAGGYVLAAKAGLVSFSIGAATVLVSTANGNAKVDLVNGNHIYSSAGITLVSGATLATLLGSGDIDATGSAGNDVLNGNRGANVLNGMGGTDTLTGGAGNDTYVDPQGDTIVETVNGGIDTIQTQTSYRLGAIANVENLTLTGTQGASATGDGNANYIRGNAAANTLDGAGGSDTLEGGAGNDIYIDPNGDKIVEAAGGGSDTISSSQTLSLAAYANVETLLLTGSGAINATGSATANRLLGNGASNALNGGDGDDTLDGGAGSDGLAGGLGNDAYYLDVAADRVSELAGQGTDTAYAAFSWTAAANVENLTLQGSADLNGAGNDLANLIIGNAGRNLLKGYTGADTLSGGIGSDSLDGGAGNDAAVGGQGDDIYYVDSAGDRVIEAAGEGLDTVFASLSWTLGVNVERLYLAAGAVNGAGNELANLLTGNDSANLLKGLLGNDTLAGSAGLDTLDGGAGDDALLGGLGDDLYYADAGGDRVVEYAGEGIDTVYSSASFTLAANVERLVLQGANLHGAGNELANSISGTSGDNILKGLDGNDTLASGAGADTLTGGLGGDVIDLGADAQRDSIVVAQLAESTGLSRDIVMNIDLNGEDRFDFPSIPRSVAAMIAQGALSEASFDSDLASAVGAAQLGAGQAVLFDPSSGSLNISGHAYLIVDANGIAGYQAGKDYVVQLNGLTGSLTLDDFI